MIFSFVLNFAFAFGFLKLTHRFEVCNDLDHYIKCAFFTGFGKVHSSLADEYIAILVLLINAIQLLRNLSKQYHIVMPSFLGALGAVSVVYIVAVGLYILFA